MTEDELLLEITRWCQALHLPMYHTHDSRRSPAGFPDLVIIGSSVLWRELKTEGGSVRREQEMWGASLLAAGQDWGIWRPSMLESGRIVTELQEIKRL
jgi:hypothetical protein